MPWETQFNELVQYKAKHGDCNVPRKQGQFGRWVDKQRFNYKKGKLSQDRINRLNGIGFDWTPSMGRSRRKALAGSQKQFTSRREKRKRRCPAQMWNLSLLRLEQKLLNLFWSRVKVLTWNLRCHCKFHPANLIKPLEKRLTTKLMRLEQ